jgi:hypothetical protein
VHNRHSALHTLRYIRSCAGKGAGCAGRVKNKTMHARATTKNNQESQLTWGTRTAPSRTTGSQHSRAYLYCTHT